MSPALDPLVQLLPYCTLWFLGMLVLWFLLGPFRQGVGARMRQSQRQAARGASRTVPLLFLLMFLGIGLWAALQIFDLQLDPSVVTNQIPQVGPVSIPVVNREIEGLPIALGGILLVILLLLWALRTLINKVTGPIRQRRSG